MQSQALTDNMHLPDTTVLYVAHTCSVPHACDGGHGAASISKHDKTLSLQLERYLVWPDATLNHAGP